MATANPKAPAVPWGSTAVASGVHVPDDCAKKKASPPPAAPGAPTTAWVPSMATELANSSPVVAEGSLSVDIRTQLGPPSR